MTISSTTTPRGFLFIYFFRLRLLLNFFVSVYLITYLFLSLCFAFIFLIWLLAFVFLFFFPCFSLFSYFLFPPPLDLFVFPFFSFHSPLCFFFFRSMCSYFLLCFSLVYLLSFLSSNISPPPHPTKLSYSFLFIRLSVMCHTGYTITFDTWLTR